MAKTIIARELDAPTLTEILYKHGLRMADIARTYGIPYRSLQNWTAPGDHVSSSRCPDYVRYLLDRVITLEKELTELKGTIASLTPQEAEDPEAL